MFSIPYVCFVLDPSQEKISSNNNEQHGTACDLIVLYQSLKWAQMTFILMKDGHDGSTRGLYLLVLLQDGVFEAEEDVYGSLVLVLQRRPDDKVVVGVLVEVGHGGNAGAEAGILVALQIYKGTAGNEAVLPGQPKRKGKKNPNPKPISSKPGKRRKSSTASK